MPRSPGRLAPSNSRRALNELRNEANANIASYEVRIALYCELRGVLP